jgi:2-keto-4-pentenoate hydratase
MGDDLEAGAAEIVEARARGLKLKSLSPAHQPGSLADAYQMQGAATARWSDRVVGWKVGATSREVQELFGIGAPVYGPVFAGNVLS